MNSFQIVETLIGRRIEDCYDVKPGSSTARFFLESKGREGNVWIPTYEAYKEIAIRIVDYYRSGETFEAGAHELWPYVDTYGGLHLAGLLDEHSRSTVLALDSTYLSNLHGEGETVYARAREALVFSDGVQVLDPFLSLQRRSVAKAWNEVGQGWRSRLRFPPSDYIERNFDVGTVPEGPYADFQVTWSACIQEAVEIRPLVDAGLIRLTPGAFAALGNMRHLMTDKDRLASIWGAINSCRTGGAGSTPEQDQTIYRAAQNLLDASALRHAAPYFFSSAQLKHAQTMLRFGMVDAAGTSELRTRRANLSTELGVKAQNLSDGDLIAIRRDQDTFVRWREMRTELSKICLGASSPAEVAEASEVLAAEWRDRLANEQRQGSTISRQFKREGLLYGTVGAVVAGGGAALTGVVSLPLIVALAAGGVLTGTLPVGVEWKRSRDLELLRGAARLAFERHLLAVERH